MIFSGLNFRSLQGRDNYTFSLQANVTNNTGTSLFAFSGTGAAGATKYLSFDFISGRIIDPNGRYVQSYKDKENFTVSGNINKTNYNYHINNSPYVLSGKKEDFAVRRFVINATGCDLDVINLNIAVSGEGNLYVSGLDISDANTAGPLEDGGIITGAIAWAATGGEFTVLSGEITDGNLTGLFRYEPSGTPATFPQNIPVGGVKGGLILSGITGIENDLLYHIPSRMWTDFGYVDQTITISGLSRAIDFSFLALGMDEKEAGNEFFTSGGTAQSGDWPLRTKTGDFTAIENWYTGGVSHATGLPINVSLAHYGGYTGVISNVVTGATTTNSGNYYSTPPHVIISGGGGTGARASGYALNSRFSGVRVYEGGSGYTSTPSILVYSGVNSVSVDAGGTGYFSNFPLEFSGGLAGGPKASGYAVAAGGTITQVVMQGGGTGYIQPTTLLSAKPGISGAKLTHSGSGYVSTPVVTLSGGGGTGAVVEPLMDYTILPRLTGTPPNSGIQLQSSGSGYDATPVVNWHNNLGGGSGAIVNIQMTNYSVSGITVINGGSGYTTAPSVIFSGYGGGTGAAATTLMGYSITGISLTTSGSGYIGTPEVIFSGGGGINSATLGVSTAVATAITGKWAYITGVTSFNLVSGGSGFSSVPTIVISGQLSATNSAAATAIAITGNPVITGFNVTSGGSGYSTGFYPLISGGGVAVGGHSGTGYVSWENGLRGSGFVTGFEIVSGGSGFDGKPFNLVISGGFTYVSDFYSVYGCEGCTFYPATGAVATRSGLGSGLLTGFKLARSPSSPAGGNPVFSGGSGYTGLPTLSVSGGDAVPSFAGFESGSGLVVLPTGFAGTVKMSQYGAATALVGSYTKSFTGQWDLLTGSGDNFYSYRDNGDISGAGLAYTGLTYHFKANGSDIGVEDKMNIRVTNVNYWDNLPLVARLTVSGSGNLIEHQVISGVR